MFHLAIDNVVLALSTIGHPSDGAMTPLGKRIAKSIEISYSKQAMARPRYQTPTSIPTYSLSFPIILHNPRKCTPFFTQKSLRLSHFPSKAPSQADYEVLKIWLQELQVLECSLQAPSWPHTQGNISQKILPPRIHSSPRKPKDNCSPKST
jgi:hypothetical protein